MTREQALKEAQHRWGKNAFALVFSGNPKFQSKREYRVGTKNGDLHYTYGFGESSWQQAFDLADAVEGALQHDGYTWDQLYAGSLTSPVAFRQKPRQHVVILFRMEHATSPYPSSR